MDLTRSSKLTNQTSKEKSIPNLLEIVLEDVLKAAQMPFDEWRALSDLPWVPLAIPVEPGHQYRVTQAGVDAAHKITDQKWRAQEEFRQTIAREEFTKLSFRAIGEAIQNCKSHVPQDAIDSNFLDQAFLTAMALDYEQSLNRLAGNARPDVDRHIPCHLFHADQGVQPFSIGPVEFRPREAWIAQFVKDTTQFALIDSVEKGRLSYDDFRSQALAPGSSPNIHQAWLVLSSLRNFRWVATIKIKGHELKQSHQKALIIVGLAIDAIGLRFQVEDARKFSKAGRQHLFAEDRLYRTISFQSNPVSFPVHIPV